MSRIAKNPVTLPSGVEYKLTGQALSVKGKNGELNWTVHPDVTITEVDGALQLSPANDSKQANALAGTTRALVNNMVIGVSEGFEKKLTMVGVGYRAKAQGKKLDLSVGFSHPVVMEMPEGVSVETPSATEIVLKGADKQRVSQIAANIRAIRPPEPYKGKGIRYTGEHIVMKEGKKKIMNKMSKNDARLRRARRGRMKMRELALTALAFIAHHAIPMRSVIPLRR